MTTLKEHMREMIVEAENKPGQPITRRLTNNLKIDVQIGDTITRLQISRTGTFPSPVEWRTVLDCLPYPPPTTNPKSAEARGRKYLLSSWPTPARLVTAGQPGQISTDTKEKI